jgi:hypothetical protein
VPKEIDRVKEWLRVSHNKFSDAEKNIEQWRDYYRGHQWRSETANRFHDVVTDNVVFSNIKTIMPAINLNNPKIFVRAKKRPYQTKEGVFDTIAGSVAFEILLNYYYRELMIKREVDRCLLDALSGYWGIMQIGYTLETEKVADDKLIEINELIKEDSVFAIRRSPLDFRADPEATDSYLSDARWVAFRWVKSLEDVKKNPRYSNTAGLKANFHVKTDFENKTNKPVEEIQSSDTASLWQRVEGWDLYDRKTRKLFTTVEEHGKFLQNDPWPTSLDGIDGHPCETLFFNDNPDEQLPIGDISIYQGAQDQLNLIASMLVSHINRISARKYVAQENSFTPAEKDKIIYGPDGTIATTSANAENALVPVKDNPISFDINMVRQMIKREIIDEQAGIADFEKGIARKFETATEPANQR